MKYGVCVQQYVERVATIWVDAESEEDAIQDALNIASLNPDKPKWQDGDDAMDVEAYAVVNAKNEIVWER